MPPQSPQLPPKPEVALALLQTASSVYIHLDPRAQDVSVPAWFKKQPQLVLQVGLNMAVPIPDLDVGREAISCTLSFNRRPEFCRIPWAAIYGLVGEDGRGMIWPDSVPAEVAAAAEGRPPVASSGRGNRAKLRLAGLPEDATEQAGEHAGQAEGSSASESESSSISSRSDDNSEEKDKEEQASPAAFVASESSGSKKRRQLPPYLRVVK